MIKMPSSTDDLEASTAELSNWLQRNTMEGFRVISTSTIHARNHHEGDFTPEIELTPWDLRLFQTESIQKGLLFHNPKPKNNKFNIIQHLKHSLSSTLHFFPPLAGRLAIVEHNDNTSSVSIICNNVGALFVHAIAENTTVSDILKSSYVPPIVHSFFPLNGAKNYEGTSKPLLAVQVTELIDGIFIGCSLNHSVADGTSFWHFFNSWAEISRGLQTVSKPPALERWFPDCIDRPIRFLFTEQNSHGLISPPTMKRVFHFTKEKIAELKAKANAEINDTNRISSLQALLSHVWLCVIRNQLVDPQEEVSFKLAIGARQRILHPPLPENYFGNALYVSIVTMKARELLEGGLGTAALEMNKTISLYTEEKLKSYYEAWINSPIMPSRTGKYTLIISSSPRFDIYSNDFGWGQLVAVRSGPANIFNGMVTFFARPDEGSIDIEVCIAYETLEAMARDSEFMDAVSI